MRFGDFVDTLFNKFPQVLLAGHTKNDERWKTSFTNFWTAYKQVDGAHPFFQSGRPWETSIPYYLHGDEGRTLRSKPVMILSWQPAIPFNGLEDLNEKGFPG